MANAPSIPSRYVIIISDCHLSAGRFVDGHLNPHEDFHFDDDMSDMIDYFSSGNYGDGVEVELFINGDFLDYLNVPVQGEFEDAITEDMSLSKTELILAGHPKVCEAFKRFASKPGKKITYLIGNHDADLFFESVRERITRAWDPEGAFPSQKVKLIADTDRVNLGQGVEVRHGNQFEAGAVLNFEKPLLSDFLDKPVLNIPWGSVYVLKIINRLRWERDYIHNVRPIKVLVIFGMILDPWFTLKFAFLSVFYFLKTRFIWSPKRRSSLKVTAEILKQETHFFLDLEREARGLLDQNPEMKTIIFGHTHRPMNKVYPDGKQYINTGTWTRMINMDWRSFGSPAHRRTFAYIQFQGDQTRCELRHWVGEHAPHAVFDG